MKLHSVLYFALALFYYIPGNAQSIIENKITPKGIIFHDKEIMRECKRGDNWCTTWAADGNQYTSLCDGYGWDTTMTREIHTSVLRITGNFHTVKGEATENYPVDYNIVDLTDRYVPYYFGYGIVSVNGTIYQYLSRQASYDFRPPFQGVNLISSPDYGKTWYRHDNLNVTNRLLDYSPDNQFFWQEQPDTVDGKAGYAFAWISACQMGQDNQQGEKDGYVYIYSPYGPRNNELNMARVPEGAIDKRDAYEFFVSRNPDGTANWSSQISERGIVHNFPKENDEGRAYGWYSWLPGVAWNEGLGLYIMVNGGSYYVDSYWDKGVNLHKKSGSLDFLYAPKPWGPWTSFYHTDYWQPAGDENERTYQPKLSPKWISEDGTEMVLIWSDAAYHWGNRKDAPNHYKWNQMKIKLQF